MIQQQCQECNKLTNNSLCSKCMLIHQSLISKVMRKLTTDQEEYIIKQYLEEESIFDLRERGNQKYEED